MGGTVPFKLLQSRRATIGTTWQHWVGSDAVGIITVAPLVMGFAESLREPPPRNEMVEGVIALMVLAAMTVIIVLLPPEPWKTVRPIALLFPILLWLAVRCRPGFAAAAVLLVSLTIIWTITFDISHFTILALLPFGDRILGAQAAILSVALCAYVLAALFAERRHHEAGLAESEARLQEALAAGAVMRSEEHTSELQSHLNLVCRLLLEKKKKHRKKPRTESATSTSASRERLLAPS